MKKAKLLFFAICSNVFAIAQPNWQINPSDFQYSMTVTTLVEVDGEELSAASDLLGAFFNGTLRGVSSPTIYVASIDKHLAFLTVFSNVITGEEIEFKLYQSSTTTEVAALSTLIFTDGKQVGSNTVPEKLTNVHIWNGSSWTPSGSPSNGSSIRIAGNYSTAIANLDVNYIEIQSGITLSVGHDEFVKVNGKLNNLGRVTVASGGSLLTMNEVVGVDFSISRQTTYNQNTGRYSMVGSPVKNASFDVLGSNALVYLYDESEAYMSSNNQGINRFKTPTESFVTKMEAGQGYFSAFTGNENGLVTYEGLINYGTINVPLSYTNQNDASEEVFQGFNLVSNPYPSAVNFQSFIDGNVNANIDQSIYIWDDFNSQSERGTNQDYLVVNATLGTTDSRSNGDSKWDGYIRSGQGFFVKAISSTTLSFTDAMKVEANNSDEGFFRKGQIEKYKLGFKGAGYNKSTIVGFLEDATTGMDTKYDAVLFSNSAFSIATFTETGEKMTIQALPSTYKGGVSISVNVPEAGNYELYLMNEEEVYSATWLYDDETGLNTDISKQAYSFHADPGEIRERFSLSREKPAVLKTPTEVRNFHIKNGWLYAINQPITAKRIVIFNIYGQEIWVSNIENDRIIDVSTLPKGVYIVSDGIVKERFAVTQ